MAKTIVSRAKMRGKKLDADCYRACVSQNEYVTETHTFNGCYGLESEPFTPFEKCYECGAFVFGAFAARAREVLGE